MRRTNAVTNVRMRGVAARVIAMTSSWESVSLPVAAARFVMQDSPATRMPSEPARMASGTVDMPMASAPIVA